MVSKVESSVRESVVRPSAANAITGNNVAEENRSHFIAGMPIVRPGIAFVDPRDYTGF
jgi:hypothetical protein